MSRDALQKHPMKTQDRSTKLHHVNAVDAAGSDHFHDQTGATFWDLGRVGALFYSDKIAGL